MAQSTPAKFGRYTVSTTMRPPKLGPGRARLEGWKAKFLERKWMILGLISLSILLAVVIGSLVQKEIEETRNLSLSGRIEADESRIGTLVAGRIKEVLVKEGDRVKRGQLLVRLDDSQVKDGVALSGRSYQMASSMASKVGKMGSSIKMPKIGGGSFKMPAAKKPKTFLGKVGHIATSPLRLLSAPFAGAQKRQAMAFRSQMIASQRKAAGMMVAQARAQARAHRLMAEAEAQRAKAAREELLIRLKNYKIYSPVDGIVTTLAVQPGDVVDAGHVVVLVQDPKKLYMRGFVPANDIARIKIGQKARVTLDGDAKKELDATVSAVDEKPSFTPENVYFREDRVKQVFGVKLSIDKSDGIEGFAKAGMPSDAEVMKSSLRETNADKNNTN